MISVLVHSTMPILLGLVKVRFHDLYISYITHCSCSFFFSAAPGATPADGPNSHTGLGGTPLAIESDIWHIGSGNSLSATWINTDGCKISHRIN